MEMVNLIDQAAIEAAKVQAVFKSLPWPQGNGKEEEQLSNMLLVLSDQIERLYDVFLQIEAAAGKVL